MPLPPVEESEGELSGWTPDSWRRFPAEQQPVYADPAAVEEVYQTYTMHVAARLPYGAVMPRALDDGSIQVDAWYSAARIVL